MTDDALRTSPAELMAILRDALVSAVSTADRLRLEWRDSAEQHRDWERLAATLFDVCVRGPIEADSGRRGSEYPLPSYDIDIASYLNSSWISVASPSFAQPAALIRLLSARDPFDTVQVAVLDPETLIPVDRTLVAFADVRFAFVRRSPSRSDAVVHEIEAVD